MTCVASPQTWQCPALARTGHPACRNQGCYSLPSSVIAPIRDLSNPNDVAQSGNWAQHENAARVGSTRRRELETSAPEATGDTEQKSLSASVSQSLWAVNPGGLSMAKSPSAWHDDARSRDAGHDEMQLRVLHDWKRLIEAPGEPRQFEKGRGYKPVWCGAEFALRSTFRGGARIEAFADIAVEFASLETDQELERRMAVNQKHEVVASEIGRRNNWPDYPAKLEEYEPRTWWMFLEVKPVIHSAGAVIRQCQALDLAAGRSGFRERFHVMAVVYEDDPKISLLKGIGGAFFAIARECQP